MLKRLELIGFKSFADKTRFDFHDGITAVVGPNGSGKSNVVDAVRWILGEQSAKSLRGGEMADVIFNGSASRRSLGMAEVTMTFDNARKILNSDAAEVQVTRRVYRDGTGEYLLNGQICRLKDLKELFLGSGAGPGTYCIIEQGRVDALLQSSTKDRRLIFEEAAGISRFKAKKLETLRKLEATSQNLSRVKDILGEIDKQLRKVRQEATKAQRWQELNERLRELRIGSSLREFDERRGKISQTQERLDSLRSDLSQTTEQMTSWELEARQIDTGLLETERLLGSLQELVNVTQQEIISRSAEFHQAVQMAERLQNEQRELSQRLAESLQRLHQQTDQRSEHGNQLAAADSRVSESTATCSRLQREWDQLEAALEENSHRVKAERQNQFELFQEASRLHNEAEKKKSDWQRLTSDYQRQRRQAEQHLAERDSFDRGLESLRLNDEQLQSRISQVRTQLEERRKERGEFIAWSQLIQQDLDELRQRREKMTGRFEALDNFEKSQEGLALGTREVMARIAGGDAALRSNVLGLVADLLNVPGELAAYVDLALGDISQHFIVRDAEELDRYLADPAHELPGKASFLPYVNLTPLDEGADTRTADRWVTSELGGLPRQLLGSTFIVENLVEARELSQNPECAGHRFVTKLRELLEPDGSLTVGTKAGESGIVSRKSELRELKSQLKILEQEIAEVEQKLSDVKKSIEASEAPIHGLEHELGMLNHQAGDLERAISENRSNRDRLAELIELNQSEMNLMAGEIGTLETTWLQLQNQAQSRQHEAEASTKRIAQGELQHQALEQNRPKLQEELTISRVALGQYQMERDNLHREQEHLEIESDRLVALTQQIEQDSANLRIRIEQIELEALSISMQIAERAARKESALAKTGELTAERNRLKARKSDLEDQLRQIRVANQQKLEELHQSDLSFRELQSQHRVLEDRLLEEFQVHLPTLYENVTESSYSHWLGETVPVPEWAREITELKEKIRKLGSVSLDALNELNEVEARAKDIKAQYDDLTEANRSLLEIIAKINGDSQRMLTETLATIREHFQVIFRQLFGGGSAEIVVEDPNDVLESGMEIIARPPGKELRSISLMSGGEKTMTAVALLLAIFRSKPSPFCLLDEVDAALDEANCQRLASALKDFTQQSQFIVITHKKRMMSVADILYGITMQESGISKQVSIRFEDWQEEKEKPRNLAA
ncbi:chromosome segregation protein SMC [Telmatocola sphagniphila]|uniref:Chromosome partition protein Smc n=1 Tax=Telmatocola sphagniphila TaxID=1123043 RepID=A0A8E6B2A9_9BACT|nr:chromosome segregation protein SMC [Telmatocola sphagniphila]QVL30598.1 chromosome segregation protein SMC [Telmatocola sphagniphila]